MSNNTQQRLASLDSSTTKALYKDLMINLWTTLLAGQGLISSNRDAKADGNITSPEQEIINHQEQVFYSSVGLLAKNIASLAREVGLLTVAGTVWRGANNLMLFVDKLDGVPSDPRPHVDIALGIAIIADMEATLAEVIDWASDTKYGKKIPPAVKVAGEVIGFASDFWSVIGNTMTDSSGNSLAVVYLDGGAQPKLPNLAEVLINIDYGQLMDDAEHRINNIIDAFLDYIPSLNPWEGQGEIKQKVFVGDKNSAGESDHFSGSEVDDIAYGLGGADSLFGNGGNDYLNGGKGNDYFDGGVGDDILIDEEGYDNYIFQGDFGHDTIYDQDGRGLIQINSISLSAGQKINDNEWQSSDGQYIISLVKDTDGVANFDSLFIHKNDDTENSITIKQWKNGDLGLTLDGLGQTTNPNEGQYAFANDGNNIIFNERYVSSAGGNDLISSTDLNDIIMSGEGNDLISSKDGDDFIAAGDGNDIVFSGKGKDTIYGEKGDDLILSSSRMSSSRYSYEVEFNKENSTEDQLIENFDGLDFKYDPDLDENNRVDSFYIINSNSVLTYQILPIFNIYYNSPYGKAYYYNILLSLNWGAGYAGGDIVYGGDGNDIIIGSSDTDYIYGGNDNDNLYGLNGNDFIYGEQGEDIINGGDGIDHIYGGADKDHIVGGHDNDHLFGGDGDDYIQGDLKNLEGTDAPPDASDYSKFGDDEIYGGDGDDQIWGNLGHDRIWGGEGNDRIRGDHLSIDGSLHGNDIIRAEEGDDLIWGDGGEDEIYGGDGDDQIQGDNGSLDGQFHKDDILDGGAGDDKIWGDGGSDRLYGGQGNDYLQGDNGSLDGQYHGDDTISGGEDDDTIFGDGGSDKITGDEGDDYLDGDNINLDGQYHGKDEIFGGDGNDTIFGQGNDDEIYGGAGDDYISGDSTELDGQYHGNDKIYGDAGNDTIYGNGGDDELYGGTGNDYLAGDQKDNREMHGNDKLFGGLGNDTLLGFDGDDILDGGEGDDIIFGGNGNDTIYSYDGNDQLAGGDGDDTYHIRVRDAEVKILDNSTSNHVYLEGDFNFSKIKLYWYSNAVSLITPTPSNNPDTVFPEFKLTFLDDSETQPVEDENGELIEGEIVKDEYGNPITGGYDQYLHFDLGLSSLRTFTTSSNTTNEYVIHLDTYLKERDGLSYQLWSGSWHGIQSPYLIFTNGYINNNNLIYKNSELGDFINIEKIRNNVTQYGQYQADEYHLLGGDDEVQGSSVDDIVYGGAGDDKIFGNLGNDQLYGDEGRDQLYGGDGDDQLYGGEGQDALHGELGNDVIDGGDGDDQLFGGDGVDEIFGGEGADTIYGENGNDKLYGGDGNDELYGGDGDDTLNGGSGNNILVGGIGTDEYILDGLLVSNTEIQDTDDSVLKLLNVNSQDIRLEVVNSDLYIHFGNNSSVKIIDYIKKPYISEIQFEDVLWSKDELNSKIIITQSGDELSNYLSGKKDFTNIIYGGDGNDTLNGGGDFKNYLYGGLGNDVLSSGGMNSETYMYGGVGVDTYNVQFYNMSWIDDEDLTGLINIDSDVYFTLVNGLFTQSVDSRLAEFISTSGKHSYYKYSLKNAPLLKIEFNSENKTLLFSKNGENVFGISGIEDVQDISNYSKINIKIGGEEVYNLSGYYSHYSETTFNFVDFINSFSNITSHYTDDDDKIQGYGELNNIIYAGDGENIITTGAGNDTIYAGNGHDEIFAGEGNNIIVSGDGGDKIVVGNGINKITSGSGNDVIILGDGRNNEVFSGAGDDLINAKKGTIYAGDGNDQIEINSGQVYGGAGDDLINVGSGTIYGEDGNDQIEISSGQVYGGEGDDIIIAGDFGVYMDGGMGTDHLIGGLGNDTFVVDEFDTYEENDSNGGYDTIHIAQSFDLALNNFEAVTLLGSQDLNAFGDEFENNLIGNEGNNYLDGRAGSDYMAGGLGNDYYVIDTVDSIIVDENGNQIVKHGDVVHEDEDNGIDTIERWKDSKFIDTDETGTLILTNSYKVLERNVENLVLKGSATVGFGNDLNNIITGNELNNYIDGLAGNDTYIYNFGGGKDTFVFRDSIDAFNNIIINGYDVNQIYARQLGNNLTLNFKENLNDQIIINNYFSDDDLVNGISYKQDEIKLSSGVFLDTNWIENSLRNLEGTDGNDTILGFSRSENIYGGSGDDYLEGDEGNDVLYGEEDDDTLYGGAGDDVIYGGAGNDILRGGMGSDTLNGGEGDDKYYYYLTDGTDVIDQTGGGVDVLWLMDYGITRDRIHFTQEENDLIVMIDQNPNQSVRIVDHFLGGEKAISSINANGQVPISAKDIDGIIKAQAYGGLYDTVLEGTVASETIYGTSRNDLIQGHDGNDTIWAQAGNDRIEGGMGNDYLDAGAGDDFIFGGSGNDTLIGGAGHDHLDGGEGDDKYYYYLADGMDIIDQTGGGHDVIWLMDQGITADRIKFTKEDNDLIIVIDNNLNQSIRVRDHFLGGGKAIAAVQPNGGYAITAAQIAMKVNASTGESGTPVNPIGDSIYQYTSGALVITEQSGIDKVVFADGIGLSQISSHLSKLNHDLIIKVNGSNTNKITVKNFFLAGDYLVESFQIATGQQLTAEQIFTAFGVTFPTEPEVPTEPEIPNVEGDTAYSYTTGELIITEQSGNDKVIFKNGITFSQVGNYLTKSGDDLILKINGSNTNKVTIKNFFLGGQYLVETFQFETGGQLTAEQIFGAFGITMPSHTESEMPTETTSSDAIGNTVYEYTTGILTISEQSGNDKVLFKNGIMFGQVGSYLTKSGDDLILKINGSETDQVIVKNFFLGGGYEVENFSFETGGSITSSQIYQVFGISRPLNAEDKVDAIVLGDIGNHVLTSDASVSELFILNDGQDILKLLQSSTGKTALDYVSDFKVSEDKLDLSAFLDQNQVNSSNIDDYLAISYDANLKTNTLSVRTDPNSPAQELLVLTNQSEYLSVQDLLLNQSIMY